MSPGGKERESLILKHRLASIQKRREEGIPIEHEEQILKEQGISRMRFNRVLSRQEPADEINKHFLVGARFSTTSRFFRFLSIHQLVIYITSPPLSHPRRCFFILVSRSV